MSISIEFARSILKVGIGTVRAKRDIPIVRYTSAPVAGIQAVFLNEINKVGLDNALKRVGHLSPFLVALNEAADIAVSAKLRREAGVRQGKFVPLIQLEHGLFDELVRKREECIDYFGRDTEIEETLHAIGNDFLLLSLNRSKFSPQGKGEIGKPSTNYRTYLELDSGMIESAYFAVTVPHVLEEAEIKLNTPCNSVNDLLGKYKLFVTEGGIKDNKIENMTETQRGILALHAVVMRMKVDDDCEGKSVDCLTKVPSFCSLNTGDLNILQEEYLLIAQKCGYPVIVQDLTRLFSHISGFIKDKASRNGLSASDDIFAGNNFYGVDRPEGNSTTLRHQMEATGVLDRLFGEDWPKS